MTLKAEQTAGQANSIEDAKQSRFYKRNFTYIAQKHIFGCLLQYKDVPIPIKGATVQVNYFHTRFEFKLFDTRSEAFHIEWHGIFLRENVSQKGVSRVQRVETKVFKRWQMAGYFCVKLPIQLYVDMCRTREFMCANVMLHTLVELCHCCLYDIINSTPTHPTKFLVYM